MKRIKEYINACQMNSGQGLHALLIFPLLIIALSATYAQDIQEQAVQAFMANQPSEAADLFETIIAQGSTDPQMYLYLAYSYEQLGLNTRGIEILEQGLPYARDQRHIFHFNMGNLYLKDERVEDAIGQFTLAIASRGSYSDAYLNRANSYLREWELGAALEDYTNFLRLAPNHGLVPDVRRMVQAIQDELNAEQARALEEARLAQLEEEQRQREAELAEQRAKEDEQRRQALLNDILGSLDQAGSETRTLGAGAEDISTEEDDFQRAD